MWLVFVNKPIKRKLFCGFVTWCLTITVLFINTPKVVSTGDLTSFLVSARTVGSY